MTTANILEEAIDLTRHYTEEERDVIYDAYMKALEIGDRKEADRLSAMMPMHPRWAKIIAEVMGKEYLQERFNITHANEVYGEGWLNAFEESVP